jgi:hypothetical protein
MVKKEIKKIMKFNDFYEAWQYLNKTEIFWHENLYEGKFTIEDIGINCFCNSLNIEVVKVDLLTDVINDNELLNKKTQVWLEAGEPYLDENISSEVQFNSHNHNYDSSGDTFEEAIIKMANLVYEHNLK